MNSGPKPGPKDLIHINGYESIKVHNVNFFISKPLALHFSFTVEGESKSLHCRNKMKKHFLGLNLSKSFTLFMTHTSLEWFRNIYGFEKKHKAFCH